MNEQPIRRSAPLRGISIRLSEIKELYTALRRLVAEAAEIEIAALVRPPGMDDAVWASGPQHVRDQWYGVDIAIMGSNGEQITGSSPDLLDAANAPPEIASISFSSLKPYQRQIPNGTPRNWLEINLDFNKPALLDWQNAVSNPTPNQSYVAAVGHNSVWIAGVFDTVTSRLNRNRNRRGFIHREFIYDLGLWLLALPIGFYATMRASSIITSLFGLSPFLLALAYVYVFLLSIWSYRVFFGYTKWIFPTVELERDRDTAKKHRTFWYAVTFSLFTAFLYDLIKNAS